MSESKNATGTVVLLSGGLDSAVLLAHEAQHARVSPLYVRVGLAWENAERRMLEQLLAAPVFNGRIAPLETLDFDMRDVYAPSHWAVRGAPPAYDTPDKDVYLAGRNIVFLTKAAIVATSRGLGRIAMGLLAGNPFPDATPAFFDAMARALTLGLDRPVEITAPLAAMHKEDVIRLGRALGVPLQLTLSCMNPQEGPIPVHCGLCSKCRERRDGFRAAGVDDPTLYANASPR
jgi:7-cyano-7-deazaguanine synthase